MENKNDIMQSDQALDSLIINSIELIQYARQLAAKQVNLVQLMRIENKEELSFYEIESAKSGWEIRTLQRQYNSSLLLQRRNHEHHSYHRREWMKED